MKTNPVQNCKITHSWNNYDYVVNLHHDVENESFIVMRFDVDLENWEEVESAGTECGALLIFYGTILECLGEEVYFAEF